MARLIIKNSYIKPQQKSYHKSNLIKYIATRNGVEKNFSTDEIVTSKQKDLINDIVKNYPNSVNCFEYEDYQKNPNAKNASEFISSSAEQNILDVRDREKYLEYIANRPRVEKISTHGLFSSSDENIKLSKVAKEIANHQGNVWTPIISLHRDDAHTTGYESAQAWQSLISENSVKIAQAMKIHPDNFRWFAAYHDEGHHPHIHMVCYSTDPKEGYLNNAGIEKIKSILQTEIFASQLKPIYAEKTLRRDELKKEVEKTFLELQQQLANTEYTNPQLEYLIGELQLRLASHKGKKQFGYLQPHTKNIVNEIVDQLAREPNISEAYNKWCDLQDELCYGYSDTAPVRVPLSQQKEFKSIKNMIIREVQSFVQVQYQDVFDDINYDKNVMSGVMAVLNLANSYNKKDSTAEEKEYAETLYNQVLEDLADIENPTTDKFTAQKIGKMYLERENVELALKWLNISAENGNNFAKRMLASIFQKGEVTEKNIEKAIELLKEMADGGDKFAQYQLGKMYFKGEDVEQDIQTAVYWFSKSAESGNEYAQNVIDYIEKSQKKQLQFGIHSLLRNIASLFQDSLPRDSTTRNMQIDSKALRKLREQKRAKGLKHTGEDLETTAGQKFN